MIVAGSSRRIRHVKDRIADHVAAEFTSDARTITSTVSGDPFFPVMVRGDAGPELTLLTDRDAIEAFYAARVTTFEILDSYRLTELRSDWYALHESVATVRHVGEFRGVAPTGERHRVHSVVLFPVDDDGIVGELEWTSVDFALVFRGTAGRTDGQRPAPDDPEPHIPHRRLARARTQEALVEAWWSGRGDEVSSALAPSAIWASKHVHERVPLDGIRSTDESPVDAIVASFGALDVRSTTQLQRATSSWFSFGEWALDVVVDGEPQPVRVASLLAFEGDRAVGHLAYSVDAAGNGGAGAW